MRNDVQPQTVFNVMLDLTLAALPEEHHNAWSACLLWDCASHSPEYLSRICPPEFKQYLIESGAGEELVAEIQQAAKNGDTSFFDDTPVVFKVLVQRGSVLVVVHDVEPDEREQRHILN